MKKIPPRPAGAKKVIARWENEGGAAPFAAFVIGFVLM